MNEIKKRQQWRAEAEGMLKQNLQTHRRVEWDPTLKRSVSIPVESPSPGKV